MSEKKLVVIARSGLHRTERRQHSLVLKKKSVNSKINEGLCQIVKEQILSEERSMFLLGQLFIVRRVPNLS